MFIPENDSQIRRACGLRISTQRDEDGRIEWVGSNAAWDCYVDKLNELDPEVISDNQNENEDENA